MSSYPDATLYVGDAATASTPVDGLIVGAGQIGSPAIPALLLGEGTAASGEPAWFFKVLSATPGAHGTVPVYESTGTEYDAMRRGVVVSPAAARNGSFSSDVVGLDVVPVGQTLYVFVVVTAISGSTPALALTLASSPSFDFVSSTTRGTFASITATGLYAFSVAGAGVSDFYWRVNGTVSGGGASCSCVVAVAVSGRTLHRSTIILPTPPEAPVAIAPTAGATDVDAFVLRWSSEGAATYDVYFGTSSPPALVSSGQTDAFYDAGALSASTVYYWKIVASNSVGTATGLIWSFTAIALPATPNTPTPANAATAIDRDSAIRWVSARADTYDVYVDTHNPPTTLVASGISGASKALGILSASTTYYFQVVATNAVGSTTGPVWSFTTGTTFSEDSMNVLSTTTSTGTQNNFNPGALSPLNILRCNNASLLTFTGLTDNGSTPSDGALLWIASVGAGQVDLASQDTGSTAANRVITGVTGTISLSPGVGRALLEYDGTTGRWRVLEHAQGAWIDVPYNSGDFTAAGGGATWTVTSGELTTFRYRLSDRTLSVAVYIGNSTYAGGAASWVNVQLPGGFTGRGAQDGPAGMTIFNGVAYPMFFAVAAGATLLQLHPAATVNFAAATDFTLLATATFEVQ